MDKKFVIFVVLLVPNLNSGLEYNRQQQRHNSNSDFLLHEAGGGGESVTVALPKRDYVAPQPSSNGNTGNREYNSQFPPLGVPSPTTKPNTGPNHVTTTKSQSPSGKRDYVAPQPSPNGNTGNRDYNSQFPALGVSSPTTKPNTVPNHGTTTKSQSTSGKRDYVAPQNSTPKPAGKVKDLINFYDDKSKDHINSQNSNGGYKQSSVGAGGHNHHVTEPTQKGSTNPSTKPLSFSSVVAGSNNPSRPPNNTPLKPVASGSSPSSSPGGLVLPSTILNRNKNSNQPTNGTSDAELQTLSEELLRKDVNNAAKYITINYQEKTSSQSTEDKAPRPLLSVADDAWNIVTIQKLVPLLDNYERDTLVNEYVTPQERNEENAFMDAIMSTSVIRHLMTFLKDKGYVTPDPRQQRDFLKQLWFSLYSRGKGKISSSGFEHIFLSEFKNGGVLGLHNWIYFAKEELANRVNYLGYLKYLQLNDKGVVMKLHFNQQGLDKPVDTMFIGTSPELEIALYTLCFVIRADNDCKLKLGNKDVEIVTHTFRYRSKNLIGSAYPQI